MTLNPTASTLPCACTDATVCDACASRQIEALNATAADYVELLPGMLTPNEQTSVTSAVTGWLNSLNGRSS